MASRINERAGEEERYEGLDPARRMEYKDAAMIKEDRNAPANLPQNVILKYFPKSNCYMPEVLDDSLGGVDKQIDLDVNAVRRGFAPKKV